MDKTLEFQQIQVAPSPFLTMIIECTGLSRLGAKQRASRMRNVDINLLLPLVHQHLVNLPVVP